MVPDSRATVISEGVEGRSWAGRSWRGPGREAMERLETVPKPLAGLLLLALTVLIGWADRVTGREVSLFLLYAFPISLSVVLIGAEAGMLISVVAAAAWWVANKPANLYETNAGYVWALASRLFYFSVVVVAVTAVRNKQKADEARITALEERRKLERDLIRVSEHEQQRIGQDLHDGLCQRLAAIGCAARMLADDLEERKAAEYQDAAMIEEAISEAVSEARNLARGIFPVHVDRSGLQAALADLGRTMSRLTGAEIRIFDDEEVKVGDPKIAMHLYRIAQEAVANAIRHGEAKEVEIRLEEEDGGLEMKIEDDGRGFVLGEARKGGGMGLSTMRYRAHLVGGKLEIGPSATKGGTVVRCHIPDLNRGAEIDDE